MTLSIKKIALPTQLLHEGDGNRITENTLGLVGGVEINCTARIGTLNLTIAELRQLKQGQMLALEQKTNEPVEIIVNQKVIARGELMSCDDYFAIQITEVAS